VQKNNKIFYNFLAPLDNALLKQVVLHVICSCLAKLTDFACIVLYRTVFFVVIK